MSPGLKRGGSSRIRVLVSLLVVSVLLFTFSVRDGGTGPVSAVRGVVQTVMLPLRYAGAAVCAPFGGLGNVVTNLTSDEKSLSELKEENEKLKAENAQLTESAQSAKRLEALLELKNTYNLKSTGARIVAGSADAGSTTVQIDKGSSSGIAVGMPVTDAYGVIGQVSEVGPSTATVRLITDERSGVSAMVQASRAQGQLVGQGTEELSLTLVRTGQAVKEGDLVVTSGLGGVYPKGLLLGTVVSVERPTGALYYNIIVRPAATVSNLEEVLVITSLTDEQKATAEDAAHADAQETSGGTAAAQQDDGSEDGTAAENDGTGNASGEGAQGNGNAGGNGNGANGTSNAAASGQGNASAADNSSATTSGQVQ